MEQKTPQTPAPSIDGLPRLITLEELAAHWSLNVATVRRWARAGVIPGCKIGPGGHWRFDVRDLREWKIAQ